MIDRDPSARVLRRFGAIYTPLALLVFTLARRTTLHPAVYAIGAVIVLVALVSPRALRWPYVLLSAVTAPIGWVTSRLLLAIIFFLVVTPIALVMRLAGRDLLLLRTKRPSYWHSRTAEARDIERNFRQY